MSAMISLSQLASNSTDPLEWDAGNEKLNLTKKKIGLEYAERMFAFHSVASVVTPMTIGTLLIVGAIGNVAVVYVTVTTRRIIKHPIHSMLVLNLAVSDLTYLVSSAPYEAITYSLPRWVFGSFLCGVLHCVNIQTMSVSIFTMCSLATLRYLGIARPFQFKASYVTRSERRAGVVIIATVWLCASVLAAPNIVFYQNVTYNRPSNSTGSFCLWSDGVEKISYQIMVILITYLVPLLLLAFLYFLISREILCYMQAKSSALQEEKKEYIRSTVMVFILALAFLICWFPFHLFTIIKMTKRYSEPKHFDVKMILNMTGHSLSYAHACVNPIIYTFAAPGFRRSLSRSSSRNPRRSQQNRSASGIENGIFPEVQLLTTTPTNGASTNVLSELSLASEHTRMMTHTNTQNWTKGHTSSLKEGQSIE